MKKFNKNIILIIIGVCVLVIIVLILLLTQRNVNDEYSEINNEILNEETSDLDFQEISIVDNRDDYFMIKSVIDEYLIYIKQINGDFFIDMSRQIESREQIIEDIQKDGINAIDSMIDELYKQEMNINSERIKEEALKLKKDGSYNNNVDYTFRINQMNEITNLSNVNIFIVNANINKIETNFIVKTDPNSSSYSLFLNDYIENIENIENILQDIEKYDVNIDSNDYNLYNYTEITDEIVANYHLQDYISLMYTDIEKAYNLLNQEYKEKRFNDINVFKKYVQDNKENLINSELTKYKVNNYESYVEYVCVDQYERIYTFKDTTIMNFSTLLDDYTIDTEEFIQEYDTASSNIKVGYNINKIAQAMNMNDYQYIYNKLDQNFKNNYFKTLQEFESYMKNTFPSLYSVDFEDSSNEGDILIQDTIFKDMENEQNTVQKQIIMKLGEGTDFIMSFNV